LDQTTSKGAVMSFTQNQITRKKSEADEYLKSDPDFSIEQWAMTEHYSDPAELQRYIEGLRKAGFPK
jgi:hypothetical protein